MKHHYIPEFYTKRWAKKNGQLCQYSKPYKNVVKPKMTSPAGTGYVDKLYELKGLPAHSPQQLEERFFKPLDNDASQALDLLEKDGNAAQLNGRMRSGWTRFILSLLLRCPEDIHAMREDYLETLYTNNEPWQSRYNAIRGSNDPESFDDYIRQQPESWRSEVFSRILTNLIDHEKIGNTINRMHWHVLEPPLSKHELLTSDRPVVMTNGLIRRESHIAFDLLPDESAFIS